MDYAPDGDLSRYEAADVADGIDYPEDPEKLMDALRHSGFLDGDQIHDWEQYGEKLFVRRQANAKRMRESRAANVQRTCDTHAEREDRTGQTGQTGQEEEHSVSTRAEEMTVFEHWKSVMGRNGATNFDDKRKKAVRWALKNYDLDTCIRAIDGYSASDFHMGRDSASGGKKYNDLTLIFRDADHAEKFLDLPQTGCEAVDRIWGGDDDD